MTEIVQLAHKYDGRVFENGVYSRKFDGKRMYIKDGVGCSRTAKICRQAPIQHILDEITSHLAKNELEVVTDGEVLYFDKDFNEDFKKAISLTSRIERSPECDGLYYVIFDIIKSSHFINSETEAIPFNWEYNTIVDIFNAKPIKGRPDLFSTSLPHILIARQVPDIEEFTEYEDFDKWEGLMYRNADAPYEFKRSHNLLKIKAWHDTECKITGFKAGIGKHLGRLGAIIVDYKGNEVAVGSGFTDQEREFIWEHQNDLINLTLRIKYFEESYDAKGNFSLRFPTYLGFRDADMEDITI